ncbi:MAG: hypothetical protein REH83_05710 [Rickettsiella sp.]|nr:hypothetical protein [Rickettsiella sp.]
MASGIIARITDLDFPKITRDDFYNLRQQLLLDLQKPFKKFESKMENSISKQSKKLIRPFKDVVFSVTEYLQRRFKESIAEEAHSVAGSNGIMQLKKQFKITKEDLHNYFSTAEDVSIHIELVCCVKLKVIFYLQVNSDSKHNMSRDINWLKKSYS